MNANSIYASTAGLARHYGTLAELLGAFTGAGLKRVELGLTPPVAGLELPHDLEQFHLSWLIHNYFPAPETPFVINLASQDPVILQRSRDFAIKAIRLSKQLGAPFYSVHCGFLADLEPNSLGRKLTYVDVCDYEKGFITFAESLKLLLSEAQMEDIRLLVEPNVVAPFNLIDGKNLLLLLAGPAEFVRLFDEIRDPRLGVLVDLGHLKVTANTLGFTTAEFVEAVAPAVGAFHLHDNDGVADQHRPIESNSWTLDVLCQNRFVDCPVIVEAKFEHVYALTEHCMWLESLLNR